jgi:hypothetical protein
VAAERVPDVRPVSTPASISDAAEQAHAAAERETPTTSEPEPAPPPLAADSVASAGLFVGERVPVSEPEPTYDEARADEPLDPQPGVATYEARLAGLRTTMREMVTSGRAARGATDWYVNGSSTRGREMARDFSALMLRAYNAAADAALLSLRTENLDTAIARLSRAHREVDRLGTSVNVRIADAYHKLRLEELEVTAAQLAELGSRSRREDAAMEPRGERPYARAQERPAPETEPSPYVAELALRLYDAERTIAEMAARLRDLAASLEHARSQRPPR